MIRVGNIVGDTLGTLVMLLAVAGNELPEKDILPIAVIDHTLTLKQPLGEIPQMHNKPAEIQRIPVKLPLVVILHYLNRPFDELGDVVHLGHIGIQLGVDNMQRNKRRFVVG